jgi:hypothetical protein
MWRVLKSEIQNHWFSLLFFMTGFLIIAVIVFTSGWESAEKDIVGLSSIMFLPAIILIFSRLSRMIREKFDRFLLLLPLGTWKIGLIRNLFGLMIWLTLLLIFLLGLLVFRFEVFDFSILWYMISLTGFFFVGNSMVLFYRDLSFCFISRYQRLIIGILYVAAIGIAINLFSVSAIQRYFPMAPIQTLIPVKMYFAQFSSSISGALFFLFLGILSVLIESWIFMRRRLYLE